MLKGGWTSCFSHCCEYSLQEAAMKGGSSWLMVWECPAWRGRCGGEEGKSCGVRSRMPLLTLSPQTGNRKWCSAHFFFFMFITRMMLPCSGIMLPYSGWCSHIQSRLSLLGQVSLYTHSETPYVLPRWPKIQPSDTKRLKITGDLYYL